MGNKLSVYKLAYFLALYDAFLYSRHVVDASVQAADGCFFCCLLEGSEASGREPEGYVDGIYISDIVSEKLGEDGCGCV